MDYSAANTELWNVLIQLGIIATAIFLANFLRRKIPIIERSLLPTAVLAGFLLLLAKIFGLISIDESFLEMITYHGIAIGFIALSLQAIKEDDAKKGHLTGPKSGALIVSTYLLQGIIGLLISLILFYTIMPDLFSASGLLLPMGFGQGPGQANNIGGTYEALGFVGGRSFGLSIAAAGYLCACIVGVIYLNILFYKGKFAKFTDHSILSGSVTVEPLQDKDEMSASESVDRLSMQIVLVVLVYLLTYLVTRSLVSGLEAVSPGVAKMISSILWGFNFIVGSLMAMGVRFLLKILRKRKFMTRQYQNNYLLSRISGTAFDLMIVAGIASINIEKLAGLWLPFILMVILGSILTFAYLFWISKKIYPEYPYEGFFSMFGMLTGTISSGILLLREVDPSFKTPAANNLVYGSSFAIAFGAPMLLFISIAPKSINLTWLTLLIIVIYMVLLISFMLGLKGKNKKI